MGSKTPTSLLVGCYSRAGTSDYRTLPSIFRVSRFRSFTTLLFYIIILKMSESRIRQNYHQDCEALINKQINMEFYASYVYLSMASYFNRDDQALTGFAAYFKKKSDEEREHGIKRSEYQANRGGRVVFQDIAKPSSTEWGTPLDAMEAALELEKTVNQSLLDLHKASENKGDAHLCDFLEAEYLAEQVEAIKEIGDMITKIKRAGDGLGLHIMDKEIGS